MLLFALYSSKRPSQDGCVKIKKLLQEGQLTFEKYPRCHVIKENEAKTKNSLMLGGGGEVQDGDPRYPPPSPMADLGPES